MDHMDGWWKGGHEKGEREDCHFMACVNSDPCFVKDYLVLDTEYAWGRKRYIDLVAAKRNPTDTDPEGWEMPHLVFIEVKCKVAACRQETSGLIERLPDAGKDLQ